MFLRDIIGEWVINIFENMDFDWVDGIKVSNFIFFKKIIKLSDFEFFYIKKKFF